MYLVTWTDIDGEYRALMTSQTDVMALYGILGSNYRVDFVHIFGIDGHSSNELDPKRGLMPMKSKA